MTQRRSELLLSRQVFKDLLQKALRKHSSFRVKAKGNSMSPTIREGDLILISPLDGKIPGCGDIVAFLRPETEAVIIHRIVRKKGTTCHIRGDNPPVQTDIVDESDILGRVTLIQRNGKEIRFGLGIEKVMIAFVVRNPFFLPTRRTMRWFFYQVRKVSGR
ncbi:MAG: S24/S26 family peptidase [Candidatus Aminicenantes bacterium]|nr:S24/S26 family peptidase [Candidatus Aminicenantes bacterium]